jgi:hypothetical protein
MAKTSRFIELKVTIGMSGDQECIMHECQKSRFKEIARDIGKLWGNDDERTEVVLVTNTTNNPRMLNPYSTVEDEIGTDHRDEPLRITAIVQHAAPDVDEQVVEIGIDVQEIADHFHAWICEKVYNALNAEFQSDDHLSRICRNRSDKTQLSIYKFKKSKYKTVTRYVKRAMTASGKLTWTLMIQIAIECIFQSRSTWRWFGPDGRPHVVCTYHGMDLQRWLRELFAQQFSEARNDVRRRHYIAEASKIRRAKALILRAADAPDESGAELFWSTSPFT